MEDAISRAEHEEFAKRMVAENQRLDDENRRQNKRLDILEENAKAQTALAVSVERLATNMEICSKSRKSRASGWKPSKAGTERCGARS